MLFVSADPVLVKKMVFKFKHFPENQMVYLNTMEFFLSDERFCFIEVICFNVWLKVKGIMLPPNNA